MHGDRRTIRGALLAAFIAVWFSGCAAGPEYSRPAPIPDGTGYLPGPASESAVSFSTASGQAQRIVEGKEVSPFWWREMGSSKLDALIDEARESSPTLAATRATLRQAQEVYNAKAGAANYPRVEGSFDSRRQRIQPAASGLSGDAREFSLFSAGVGVRYAFDFSGGNRQALEALAARSDYEWYRLAGARLTLAANISITAINQARLSGQMEILKGILMSQEEQMELTGQEVRLGHAALDDLLSVQTQVEKTRAGIPLLRDQLQQNQHLLAVLIGREPGAAGLPSFVMEDFDLPRELPLVVPSELVRKRPDILGAEAMLQTANAEYGVAVSRLYPQLNLSADLGSQALTMGGLFGGGSSVWSIVGQLTQPLFSPGLPAGKRAALAAFDAAAANYQSVVLESLRSVADVLRALENDTARFNALQTADAASQESLDSTRRRYSLGAASYYNLLIAQQQRQEIRFDLIECQGKRLLNSVAFFQAMGGGDFREGINSASLQ